jgi:predicted Zn-dependent peptidase
VYHVTQLDCGLTVVSAALPHMASVALGVWIGVGGRYETASQSGISHFIEHLLFKGTRRRTAAQISQSVEGMGGYLNAFTDEEHTCLYARARADRLEILVDVLLDMYLDSRFAPAEITRERSVIKEEIAMYRDQPAEQIHDLLNALQFPRHPLGRPVIGTSRTLDTIGRPEILRHLQHHYVAGGTVIAAAGAVEHEALVGLIRPWTDRFRPGKRPAFVPAPGPGIAPSVRVVQKPVEQANLALAIRACSRHSPDRFALRLLNVILGENMSSRLFQVVRERHGLTYNIQSSASFWDDCGDLVITAGLDPSEVSKTIRLVRKEMERLSSRLTGRDEFDRARDYVLGQFDLHLESTENHMMALGEMWLGFGRLVPPVETRRDLLTVTPTDVRRVAREFFRPDRLSLAVITPRPPRESLESILVEG